MISEKNVDFNGNLVLIHKLYMLWVFFIHTTIFCGSVVKISVYMLSKYVEKLSTSLCLTFLVTLFIIF